MIVEQVKKRRVNKLRELIDVCGRHYFERGPNFFVFASFSSRFVRP